MEALVHVCVVLLEGMFFVGLFGSALVVLLMTIEDVIVLLEKDEALPGPPIGQHR